MPNCVCLPHSPDVLSAQLQEVISVCQREENGTGQWQTEERQEEHPVSEDNEAFESVYSISCPPTYSNSTVLTIEAIPLLSQLLAHTYSLLFCKLKESFC